MKGKVLLCVVLIGISAIAANIYEKPVKLVKIEKIENMEKIEKTKNLENLIAPIVATPAPIQIKASIKPEKMSYLLKPLDVQVTHNEGIDQNPAIVTDGAGNLLTMHEIEVESMEFDIGLSISTDVGTTWELMGYFPVDGAPTQPRLDFYKGKTAYGTWTADPMAAFGYAYYAEFPDITDPEVGEYGWVYYRIPWGEHDIGVPFTSSDVACYATDTPPTPDFWGIVAFTGDQAYREYAEDNTFMFQYNTEEGYVTIIFFYNMDEDVFNVAADIDQSTGWFVMAADFVNETDSSIYGTMVLARKITSNEEWWRGSWTGVLIYNCTHPAIDANDGRIYIVTEMDVEDGSKEIVCWTSTNPANWQAWQGYYITVTPGITEQYPAITAISNQEAMVLYTKNRNVYVCKTEDGGETWSSEEQVNDISSTVIEQYGCLDIMDAYAVWTDESVGNYEIFFDIVGKAPVIEIYISGGFGVKATISNTGDAPAENLPWSISLEGLVIVGSYKEGIIPSLQPGQSVIVKSGLVLGFGKVTITVTAGSTSATATGFLIGPFVLIS